MVTLEAGLLWAGVAYFLGMATAHVTDFKTPTCSFDVPSMFYQNKIISFACVMKKRDEDSELKPGVIWHRRATLAY